MTPDQLQQARSLREEGKTFSAIGREMGFSGEAIRQALKEPVKRKLPVELRLSQRLKAMEMKKSGAKLKEITAALGISRAYASKLTKSASAETTFVLKNPPWLESARQDYRRGMKKKDIAQRYNCTFSQARRLLEGVSWGEEKEDKLKERDKRIGAQFLLGRSVDELTMLFELSPTRIRVILDRDGLSRMVPSRRGVDPAKRERIKKRNEEILELKRHNFSAFEIAKRFGMTDRAVRKVCAKAGLAFREGPRPREKAEPKPPLHLAHVTAYKKHLHNNRPRPDRDRSRERARVRARLQIADKAFKAQYNPNAGLSPAEVRRREMKKRIGSLIARDRAVRETRPVTLPRISIQQIDF